MADYDDDNVFARILRGEIPNRTILETEHTLAFEDVRPQAPTHILVIPKGRYATADDFALEASEAEIVDFTRVVGRVCAEMKLRPGEGGDGYRLISNAGQDGVQEVPHYHLHVLAGRRLGRMLERA